MNICKPTNSGPKMLPMTWVYVLISYLIFSSDFPRCNPDLEFRSYHFPLFFQKLVLKLFMHANLVFELCKKSIIICHNFYNFINPSKYRIWYVIDTVVIDNLLIFFNVLRQLYTNIILNDKKIISLFMYVILLRGAYK